MGDKLIGNVPKIALIQTTKKLVKKFFLNKFGHKGQISNRPKVFKHIWVKRDFFKRV